MIVQSASPEGLHLVLTMEEHTDTAEVLAAHFGGNADFLRPEPRELFLGLVAEHDRGWVEVDTGAPRDPGTDLPWSVYQAPLVHSLTAGVRSIDHNERRHPYRGLLSSMHISGLHNGRFGLNEPPPRDRFTAAELSDLDDFLRNEEARRVRLRSDLSSDPNTAAWVEEPALMDNYKALQLFDRLALWLQVTHPTDRVPIVFDHVPTGSSDVWIGVEPVDRVTVCLDPYPFDTDGLRLTMTGRAIRPQPASADLAEALRRSPRQAQEVVLVSRM